MKQGLMEEWEKRNEILVVQMEKFCDEYKKKQKHKCDESCNMRIYPNGKSYCDKMIAARAKKFDSRVKKEIIALMNSQKIV